MIRIVSCVALIGILSLPQCELNNVVTADDYSQLKTKIDESLRNAQEKLEWSKQFRIRRLQEFEQRRIRIQEKEMRKLNRNEMYLAFV